MTAKAKQLSSLDSLEICVGLMYLWVKITGNSNVAEQKENITFVLFQITQKKVSGGGGVK